MRNRKVSTNRRTRKAREPYGLPRVNLQKLTDKLVKEIGYLSKSSGRSKVLIGLSGGVDSSVLCALACRAVGPDNVYALQLTYITDDEARVKDAAIVAREFKIRFKRIDITDSVEMLADILRIPFHGDEAQFRRSEILDRFRMLILMDISEQEQMLYLSAGNRTDELLGLGLSCGLFGPAPNPLIKLYKTYTFQLAEYLELPEQVRIRQPRMEFWKSPLDAPMREVFERIDQVLHLRVDKKYPPSRIKKMGFPPRFVNAVIKRLEEARRRRLSSSRYS